MAALLDEDPAVAAHAATVVLDIEASGFGRDSYPIEVGFVLPGGEPYCSLIRLVAGWVRWDVQAQQVHGITRETVMEYGRDVREVRIGFSNALFRADCTLNKAPDALESVFGVSCDLPRFDGAAEKRLPRVSSAGYP